MMRWNSIKGLVVVGVASGLVILAVYLPRILPNILAAWRKNKVANEKYYPEPSVYQPSDDMLTGSSTRGPIDLTPEIFVQMGHIAGSFSYTNAVEFMSGEKHILTGNGDGTIKLWETTTGREVKTFRCKDGVMNIDISSDGKYLVSGDSYHENNINIWEISTGKKSKSFNSDNSCNGYPILFCNNDNNILSGAGNEMIRLWDIESGELIREFKADSGSSIKPDVSSIVLTPDGKTAIAGYRYNGKEEVNGVMQDIDSRDYTIRVWDLATGEETLAFNKGNGWVEALDITPDGKYIISGDWQQDSVRVWDINTGKQTNAYPGYTSAIDISSGGRYALFGGCMGFSLVELSTGKVIRKIDKGIDGWVRSIKFSPDGKYALVGDDSSKPMLWNLATGLIASEFGGYSEKLETVKLSKTGKVMLTAHDYSDMIKIWDYNNGRLIKTIDRDSSSIMSSATISSDGKLMATGGWSYKSRTSNAIIWDIATSKQITRMELAKESGTHTSFLYITDDNKYLIWACQPYIVISDIKSGKEIKKISDSSLSIKQIRVDPNGKYIIAPSYSGGTKMFSLPEGELIKVLSKGYDLCCIIGKEYFYEFASVRNKDGWGERFLSVYDLENLKEKTRKKVGDVYFGPGVEYNTDFLYFSYWFGSVIEKYDLNQNKVVTKFSGHTGDIANIETTPDGKFLCTSSADGTARFWDPVTGREVAQFISFSNGEWIVITPEGYFNASPEGAKHLNVRVGNEVYSIDNFYEKFYNPAYVASVLQGGTAVAASDIRKGILAPPAVRITSPEPGKVYTSDVAAITVSVKDMGGGIDEIRLYHNGKAIGKETRGIKIVSHETGSAKTYNVTLVAGPNTFRATGFSRDRTESNPHEVTVTLAAPKKDISLYVLAAGINTYKNPALSLNYAEPDARGIADFFKKKGPGLFKQTYVTDIYNEQATKAGIISQLTQLQKTNPQDVVLIYLAGHGENVNDKWYFIPYELTYPEREAEVKAKAISSDELSKYIKNIKAQKILVLIDACKAGAVLVAFRGFEDRKALSQLSRSTGVHIVAASTKSQFAAEVKELGHGVFTYTLLEGLSGKAVGKGETVTVRKLMGYIEEQLPEITKKYQQEAQYPVVDSRGMDFPLVISK